MGGYTPDPFCSFSKNLLLPACSLFAVVLFQFCNLLAGGVKDGLRSFLGRALSKLKLLVITLIGIGKYGVLKDRRIVDYFRYIGKVVSLLYGSCDLTVCL